MRKTNCQNRKTSREHDSLLIIVYFLSSCIILIILSNISFNITLNIESILGNILQAGSPKLNDNVKANIFEESRKRAETVSSDDYDRRLNSLIGADKIMGVWGPTSNRNYTLEKLEGINQSNAIANMVTQGFNEYYFVMTDFRNPAKVNSTESLLKAADNHDLKIVIILLPPSEGDLDGNYDWKGWIEYLNSVKERYPNSFEGFTIDDFNWISTRNDTRFEYNINFMESSDLLQALKDKRDDVKFYPTVYFEGKKSDVVVEEFLNYVDGVLAVSACYYNVSALEPQLHIFREIFDDRPIRYIVYPTITHNYSRQHYSPPSDQLVMSTLSIASRITDGLIIWHKIDNPVVQEYLENADNEVYISKMDRMKRLQIKEEHAGSTVNQVLQKNSTEIENNCRKWYNTYTYAYNHWLNSRSFSEAEDNEWEQEMLRFITK
jgi:hypothetical protein